MNILHADDLRKENQKLSEEYRNDFQEKLIYKIEEMTRPGKDLWQLNILNIAPGREFNADVEFVVKAVQHTLKEKGYESWLENDRMFYWSINKNEVHIRYSENT